MDFAKARVKMNFLVLTFWIVCCSSVFGKAKPRLLNDEEADSLTVTIQPESQKVMEGSPIVFTCISSIDDVTRIQWKNGYKKVNPSKDGAHVHRIADNVSVLRIDKADLKKHRKTITCEVMIREIGLTAKAVASVKIFRQGRVRKNFPVLLDYPRVPLTVDQSEYMFSLTCTSEILPGSREAPTWRWIKNKTVDLGLAMQIEDKDDIRILMPRPGVLEIMEIRESDSGTYECIAENRRGSAYSEPIAVEVVAAPPEVDYCTDRKGEMVPSGNIYHPSLDPCIECECVDGEPEFCATVMCDEPPCRNYELIEGTCCGYVCPDEGKHNQTHGQDGSCQQYLGSYCREFIQGRNIFMTSQHTQMEVEDKLSMLFEGAEMLSETCMEHILPFICFYTVPICDNFVNEPRGRPVCREDCEMVASTCQDEYYVFRDEMIDGAKVLPQCEVLPPRESGENCVRFEEFIDSGEEDETRTDPRREGDFEMCIDRYGKNVSHGKLYLPDEDPCTACTCNNGAREGCRMVTCEEPHCQNFVRSRDACCGYTCIETHVSNITSSCRSFDGSIAEDGQEFQPTSDPCVQCLCVAGLKGPCRSIACQPPDCPHPKPVPGLCCSFTCDELEIDTGFVKEPCIDYNGTRIENGEYQPGSDPCTTCQCVRGRKEVCMSVGCIPPDCPRPEPVPGVCCKYVCREPEMIHVEENSEAGSCRSFDGSIAEDGQEFQPTSDPCVQCLCVAGLKGPCRSIACQPPDCPHPKPVPGLCCSFTCDELEIDTGFVKGPCIAYNGTHVENGVFQPGGDPCIKCECISGRIAACIGCVPPDCPDPEPVPGVCCQYICRETNLYHGGPQLPGSLSVQQIGPKSVIVQWKFNDSRQIQNSMLSLVYNCTMNNTLINVTLHTNRTYVILNDLHLNTRYNAMLLLSNHEEPAFLDSVNFTLDGRVGRTLYLGDIAHGHVYESRGSGREFTGFFAIENKENVHIVMDSFHRIETKISNYKPCRIPTGCGIVQFYMYKQDGELSPIVSFMFDDERDFNWAKSHL